VGTIMFGMFLRHPRLSAAAYFYAVQTISSPFGVLRFRPIGRTPLRDSRYTLLVWGQTPLFMRFPNWQFMHRIWKPSG
jgi:hypothetical protein